MVEDDNTPEAPEDLDLNRAVQVTGTFGARQFREMAGKFVVIGLQPTSGATNFASNMVPSAIVALLREVADTIENNAVSSVPFIPFLGRLVDDEEKR